MFAITLDFSLDSVTRIDREMEAQAWADDYAPGCTARIVVERANADVVEVSAPTREMLVAAIAVYDGGNGEVDYIAQEIVER